MASPCEVLIEGGPEAAAQTALETCAREAWRIESKFSRYRAGSVVHTIHASRGTPVHVDEETAELLDFAGRCYQLSDGRFDITSGVLRNAWTFDGSDRLPAPEEVERLRPLVGWEKVRWEPPHVLLPEEMELDLGGIGKEYAVDRAFGKIGEALGTPFLVNFGGDLRANRPRSGGAAWKVGIERHGRGGAHAVLDLAQGALATSGDSRRFLLRNGLRYPHILDPRTCWPVSGAPASVTVAAGSCLEAGMLATFAMLRGSGAERFLKAEGAQYWCVRQAGVDHPPPPPPKRPPIAE